MQYPECGQHDKTMASCYEEICALKRKDLQYKTRLILQCSLFSVLLVHTLEWK